MDDEEAEESRGGGESYTVGQVAAFAHVTVRTLHHYDEIGLLVPGDRSAAGYRRYSGDDLARLQRILFYRELGFGLDEITKILDDTGHILRILSVRDFTPVPSPPVS